MILFLYRLRAFGWYYLHLSQPLRLRVGPAWSLACMQWTRENGKLYRFGWPH